MNVHMSCCGSVLGGPHEFGCEDALGPLPDIWPARRDGRIVWLTSADESIHYATHDEAVEAEEMAREAVTAEPPRDPAHGDISFGAMLARIASEKAKSGELLVIVSFRVSLGER